MFTGRVLSPAQVPMAAAGISSPRNSSARERRRFCRRRRPRLTRDFTVPTGQSMILAISS